MAIQDLISPGVGFGPGSIEFIVTRGMESGAAAVPAPVSGGLFRMGLDRLGLGLSWIVGILQLRPHWKLA